MALRVLLLSLCCLGVLGDTHNSSGAYRLRLEGGASRCQGEVQLQRPGLDWTPLGPDYYDYVPLEFGSRVCSELDCGSALSLSVERKPTPERKAVKVKGDCDEPELIDCFDKETSDSDQSLHLNCSDSVRLVGGSGLCSGSLQIWDQSWISVCEGALDLRGAEVLCRELGCRGPSVLQGELSSLGQTFHCEGHESALVDCPRSRPKTCPSGPSEDVICSEPLRLEGGASRCAGILELRHRGQWRKGDPKFWTLEQTAAVCRDLDCGSAVNGTWVSDLPSSPVWRVSGSCVRRSPVRECARPSHSSSPYGLKSVMKTSVSQTLCPECDEDLCLRLCVQSVMKTSLSQTLCPECDEDLSVSDSVSRV
uniref:SRCR domain-containing protein n=1 Tax=Knipowitschia caucasica TaxID=637954 RepID=A0AAV2L667_KNICA